jgi:CBS domain-containing protein
LNTLWNKPVRTYASEPLIFVRPETSLVDVHDLITKHDISAVPVVGDRGELAGIISTKDLLREARIDLAAPGERARITPPPRSARDLMRRDVVTVDENAPLLDAARKMTDHHIHRLVTTRDGAPAGILSTRDAMRAVLRQHVETPLEKVMTTPVETIDNGDTIRSAIERLDDMNVRGLVVVDGAWPIGVFTHAEAIQARALPSMFLDSPVEEVMSYETICLDIKAPLYRVAGYAIQMQVRRILVVHARELHGIVTGFDLVRVMTL